MFSLSSRTYRLGVYGRLQTDLWVEKKLDLASKGFTFMYQCMFYYMFKERNKMLEMPLENKFLQLTSKVQLPNCWLVCSHQIIAILKWRSAISSDPDSKLSLAAVSIFIWFKLISSFLGDFDLHSLANNENAAISAVPMDHKSPFTSSHHVL